MMDSSDAVSHEESGTRLAVARRDKSAVSASAQLHWLCESNHSALLMLLVIYILPSDHPARDLHVLLGRAQCSGRSCRGSPLPWMPALPLSPRLLLPPLRLRCAQLLFIQQGTVSLGGVRSRIHATLGHGGPLAEGKGLP